jgi:hypothetical protein
MTDEQATLISNSLLKIASALFAVSESIDGLTASMPEIPLVEGREAVALHCETFHNFDSAVRIRTIKDE